MGAYVNHIPIALFSAPKTVRDSLSHSDCNRRSTSFSGMEESDTSDWSDTDSEESSQGSLQLTDLLRSTNAERGGGVIGSTSHRTTDASGRKKKGIKSKIARKLGKVRQSRMVMRVVRVQSGISVDSKGFCCFPLDRIAGKAQPEPVAERRPFGSSRCRTRRAILPLGTHSADATLIAAETRHRGWLAHCCVCGGTRQVSAKNIQAHPRSAANSPLLRRAFKNSNGKRASMGDTASAVSESDNDFDDDDDDDFTATDTDTATDVDSDESDDSDDDQGPVRSQSAIAGHARTSSFLSAPPVAAAPGSASPFSKGHRRGQSVDHAALKKLVPQESAGMAIPSGSVDELKVAQGRRAEGAGAGAEEKAGSAKGEKKKAKHGAKQEAREAKAQKRKQEQTQKKTTKLAKRFALTESSKYLSGTCTVHRDRTGQQDDANTRCVRVSAEMKCTYVSGNLFKGKLYIISNCLCFYSSALAGVTKVWPLPLLQLALAVRGLTCWLVCSCASISQIVVPWGAVTTIVKRQEKRGDAVEVNTNDNNFVFSGFDDRDAALAEITQRWQAHKKRS